MFRLLNWRAVVCSLMLLFFASPVLAQNNEWTNITNTGNLFQTPGNWTVGVPDAATAAWFVQPGAYSVGWDAATGNTTSANTIVLPGANVTFENIDGGTHSHSSSLTVAGMLTLDGIDLDMGGPSLVQGGSPTVGAQLTIKGGSIVDTAGAQIQSVQEGANGQDASVLVTGAGSRWVNQNQLSLNVNGGDVLLNIAAGATVVTNSIGTDVDSVGTLAISVTGFNSRLDVTSDLDLNYSELHIGSNGSVFVGGRTSISSGSAVNLSSGSFDFGRTTIAEYGRINATGGLLAGNVGVTGFNNVADLDALVVLPGVNTTGVRFENSGALLGSGVLDRGLTNNADGEVRTLAGESVRFNAAGIVNSGQFNNFGGSVEFVQGLTNHAGGEINNTGGTVFAKSIVNQAGGQLNGRGVYLTSDGITNEGQMSFSASTTDLFGDVANLAGGQIISTGEGTLTFYDDVVHNGSEIRTALGSNTVFFGSLTGAGPMTGAGDVFIESGFQPGNSPAVVSFGGNLTLGEAALTSIELAGVNDGQFDQLLINGDFDVNGFLSVSLIDGFKLSPNQQFLIANVGGDLNGEFLNLADGASVGAFGGRELFISYGGFGGSNGISLFTAVPEPGSAGALAIGAMLLLRRRTRRRTPEPIRRGGLAAGLGS